MGREGWNSVPQTLGPAPVGQEGKEPQDGASRGPREFHSGRSQVKTICVQRDPQHSLKKKKKIRHGEKRLRSLRALLDTGMGAFPPHKTAYFLNHLYWTQRMLKRPRKKNSLFLKETQSSQGKHDLQTMS